MRVSVIIPALNEEGCIADTVDAVRREAPYEILVVDGGSVDQTVQRAAQADRVIQSPPGRALQMNVGADQATGDALLFLHADCLLERGALHEAQRVLSRSNIAAGCFRMRVAAEGFLYRCIDFCATARVRLTGIIYGDQGLFLRRDVFDRIGGIPSVRFMEDVLVSLRLRRSGRMVVAPSRIFVSPRRWQRRGLIRQTLRNWGLTTLAAVGVHPDRLARFYPAVR